MGRFGVLVAGFVERECDLTVRLARWRSWWNIAKSVRTLLNWMDKLDSLLASYRSHAYLDA